MKFLKPIFIFKFATLFFISKLAFASAAPIQVDLDQIILPAGGNTPVTISLDPIKKYADSLWNINCEVQNLSDHEIITKMGITMTIYSSWPSAQVNGKNIFIRSEPQVSLKPGRNEYVLGEVRNVGFSTLNFINFDDLNVINVRCTAVLANTL